MRFIFKLYQFYLPESVALKVKAQMSLSKGVFNGARSNVSHPAQRKMNSGTIFIHASNDFWPSLHWILTL